MTELPDTLGKVSNEGETALLYAPPSTARTYFPMYRSMLLALYCIT